MKGIAFSWSLLLIIGSFLLGGHRPYMPECPLSKVEGGPLSKVEGGPLSKVEGGTLSKVEGGTLSEVEGDPAFYKAKALPGDGVYSLLRRYDLAEYSCNHRQFYSLNKLREGAALFANKEYLLPIQVYAFNGKTIRSTIGINDYPLAKKIEAYNDSLTARGLRPDFRKNLELWVPWHIFHCPQKDLQIPAPPVATTEEASSKPDKGTFPPSGSKRHYPIFGKEYEYVPLRDTRLQGKIFYIVTGHGGPDPGAMSKKAGHNLCEDEYAYDVGLRLARKLLEHGAIAYVIVRDPNDGIRNDEYLGCDTDEVVWGNKKIPAGQKPRLEQRSNIVNQLYEQNKKAGATYQRLIVIHVDSRNQRQQTDLFFYYYPGKTTSKAFAQQLHRTFKEKYKIHRSSGQYHGTVSARDLHMLRETTLPSVYIELGNIRNNWDRKRIMPASNREALANWICQGILRK